MYCFLLSSDQINQTTSVKATLKTRTVHIGGPTVRECAKYSLWKDNNLYEGYEAEY